MTNYEIDIGEGVERELGIRYAEEGGIDQDGGLERSSASLWVQRRKTKAT